MVKRISILFFAAAIIVTGIIAMGRVSFVDRSVRIFNLSQMEKQPRGGRDRGGFEGRRPPQGMRERNMPDSLRRPFEGRQRSETRDGLREGRDRGLRGGGDFRRDGHNGGSKINLVTVGWYLAVFALFTLLAVYTDKALSYVRRRRNT